MRAVVLRSLVVIGAGGLVLAGVLYVASTVDARPPEVLSISVTQPVAGDPSEALITTSIEVAFSEPIEADAAVDAIRLEPAVEGTATWSGSTLIFTPASPLELETGYVVTVAPGIRDLAGNEMAETPPPFSFETAGRPQVVATDPAPDMDAVPVDQAVAITFSTLMDTAAVDAHLRIRPAIAHDLRWSGELLEIVPTDPMRAETRYEVSIGADATDAAGVAIGESFTFGFRTAEPGLRVDALVPADGIDGIAPTTSIAIIFDRGIDPGSVDDEALRLTPNVAGTVDVVSMPGEQPAEPGSGRLLRFTPSGPLPPNTTFDVEMASGIASAVEGGSLAEPVTWSFTTGTPAGTISNHVTFIDDRAGVANVWAMNPDGTGQHQVSAELAPVLDYAVAPDGSSLVVADGRRLTFLRADGSDRRVLTDDAHWEFDPAYAPNGQRVAFGRADATTGAGLGLWQWEVGGGEPEPIELPADLRAPPAPSPSATVVESLLRAPRFAPDGLALAFVDASGAVGVVELPAQRLTRVPFDAAAAPIWLPDSRAILLAGQPDGVERAASVRAPVAPLVPGDDDAVYRLSRSGTSPTATDLVEGWRVLAVAADGTIAYATDRGALHTASSVDTVRDPAIVPDSRVAAAAFAPGEEAMVIVVADGDGETGAVERLDLPSGRRSVLAQEGSRPRWLP